MLSGITGGKGRCSGEAWGSGNPGNITSVGPGLDREVV